MKYFILLLATISTILSYSQDHEEKPIHWTGLMRIKLENKVYDFNKIGQLGNFNAATLGVTSYGLGKTRHATNRTGFIPFQVEMTVRDGRLNLDQYRVALLRDGWQSYDKNYYSAVFLNALQWDREEFRGNALPVRIDRFKFFELEYRGAIPLGGDKVKLVFMGKIAPYHLTRNSEMPADLLEGIEEATGIDDYKYGYERPGGDKPIWQIIGQGVEVYKFRATQRGVYNGDNLITQTIPKAFESFLGDSDFMIGVELFKFLEAKVGVSFDYSTGIYGEHLTGDIYINDKILLMESVKKKLDLSLDLGKAFKNSKTLRGVTFYSYVHAENFKTWVEEELEVKPDVVVPYSYQSKNSIAGVGVRWNFDRSRKYESVVKPVFSF
ncbi:MAG: hypothetical protein H6621_09980 [Halobacteriovoraceae bacterium]|nr:hypothetical protein [Halobacteriovoraceae bacterium]MCB9095385.1 hypothetical protein [Halobacteriovoraceae bacterium]